MKFGEFELSIIRECTFSLDGGAMFGVVPKSLWSKVAPADELNRISLACNLLLIKTAHGNVLIETGMGARWSQKEQERYQLKTLVDPDHPLKELGLRNEDVHAVVISHLHFDHVGGAVRSENGHLVPTFPNAKYIVQKGEWHFAQTANARARASYRKDDYEPLEKAGCLSLVDGDYEVVPGVSVCVTGGHTTHHQVVTFKSGQNKGVYFADIVPTRNHVSPPWVMGYDHFPLESCDVKTKWLTDAARDEWLVVFDHEAGVPWGRVKILEGNKFEFVALEKETLQLGLPNSMHSIAP